MGIFSSIREAIFGKRDTPTTTGTTTGTANPSAMPQMTPGAPVDVDTILADMHRAKGGDSNYKTSIVDLMKLLDLDSSLENRKELATELGYTGEKDGSAEMNIWLHKAVMKKLAANGGKVSADLMN